jgi:ribosomal protein L7/L12|tara:strand:- start:171 stop:620 length:450 start_codon:yes stop_codon:yes gene_type:complete
VDKTLIIERLEMLISLIEKTEPDEPNEKNLFGNHAITAMEMIQKVRYWDTGKNVQDPDSEREDLISMMKCANRIWKTRNKIKNGEWDSLEMLEVHETIEEHLAQNAKIAAIKYYRETMKTHFDEKVSLREAKDFVDAIQNDMKRKGVIN